MKHPIQKTYIDPKGTFRFVKNNVVMAMLKELKSRGFGLNELHDVCDDCTKDDWDQFNQLIGYSVSSAPINEEIIEITYQGFDDGEIINDNPNTMKDSYYEDAYNKLKKDLRIPMSNLFQIHPDDLED